MIWHSFFSDGRNIHPKRAETITYLDVPLEVRIKG